MDNPDLPPRAPLLIEILRACAKFFAVGEAELKGDLRLPALVQARHVAMFLCRVDGKKSYPEIGRFFDCHNTTVLHADRKIFAMREAGDSVLEVQLQAIRLLIGEGLGARMWLGDPIHLSACRNCNELRMELLAARQEIQELRLRFGCG